MFINQTKNQSVIHALFQGKTVQYYNPHGFDNKWHDYDLQYSLDNDEPFGPWHCADYYQW